MLYVVILFVGWDVVPLVVVGVGMMKSFFFFEIGKCRVTLAFSV